MNSDERSDPQRPKVGQDISARYADGLSWMEIIWNFGTAQSVMETMSIARIICSVMNIFANNKETKEENYVEKR